MDGKERNFTKRDFLKMGGFGIMALAHLSNPFFAYSSLQKKKDERIYKNEPKKIDVHAHFHPPEFFQEIEKRLGKSEQMLGWNLLKMKRDTFMQTYSIEERLEWMSKFGIEKSVFSFPNINVFMDEIAEPKKRNEMSQFINDFFANTHQKYPSRALFFADVPLGTDPDFSIKELQRAITELGLHGVAIQTNNAGKLPHERVFDDFFFKVERLGVPVFMHPSKSPWFDSAYSGLKKYMFEPVVGFPMDATITIAYMIIDGFFERRKNCKIILTHLGSTIPYIYERIGIWIRNPYVAPMISGKANLTKTPLEYLKMFYYDTAVGNPEALQLCENLLDENKILFGTDHPYIESSEHVTIDYIEKARLTKRQREKVYFKNAITLFKLKA